LNYARAGKFLDDFAVPVRPLPAPCTALPEPTSCHRGSPASEREAMPTEQYHEPPEELSQETRTYARMITSLIEEAEAIGWYTQRISLEPDAEAKAIMQNALKEEFKHFGMDLEFLLRRTPAWRKELKKILFSKGDIVERGEEAEDSVD
jgi:hypothetical protein